MKSSKYNGVLWHKSSKKYIARIGINKKKLYIGYFDNELDAAICYDSYVNNNNLIGYRINFPPPVPESPIPNTKLIRLTQGYFAIVDEEDFERVNQYKWNLHKGKTTYYAIGSVVFNGVKVRMQMHRFILGNSSPEVDHKNHDGLHNYKSNIREATKSQNMMNKSIKENTSSLYKGVSLNSKGGKWVAYISINRKKRHIGCFDSEIDAAKAYNSKAIELFGEFAKLNDV